MGIPIDHSNHLSSRRSGAMGARKRRNALELAVSGEILTIILLKGRFLRQIAGNLPGSVVIGGLKKFPDKIWISKVFRVLVSSQS